MRQVYTEIFRRMDLKAEFRRYPAKRAGMEADAGNVDGELGRPYEYLSEHTNLIRVEETVFPLNFSAFTAQTSIPELNGWNSLKGTDYRVGYIRGIRTVESNLPKVVVSENLSDVTEPAQGLKQLISGRIDLFVDEESGILTLLNTPEFKDSKIRSAGIMGSVHLYPYLHKKHAALAPKMAEIIRAVKAEGLIEQYRMMVEKEFGIVRQ
ncbi:MAG: transporter substrate-binding domain-containing protein [Desulfobacteraceae bacterium]|nr:transporter substrate-binding domain-containing protein [Desulfobacteraceae bacterium]